MAFTNQQIADYYKSTVGAGSMTEAQFVDLAKQNNIGNDQLVATQGMLLSGYGSAAPAPTTAPTYSPPPAYSPPTTSTSSTGGGGYWSAPSYDGGGASPTPPAAPTTTAPTVNYSHPTNQSMPSFVTGNHAEMSRWAGMDSGTVNNIRGMIDGYAGGTVDSAAVGRAATAANLSGAQLAQLVNDRLGTNFTSEQAVAFARTSSPGTQFGQNKDYTAGYGGWQPVGSPYAGDNPMPPAYIQRLPEIQASTANAVNFALQKAIEAQVRNGYDPEKSNAVQTLRGYYSDDPQLRSNAIRAAAYYAKDVSQNAYETADYGYHAIVGFDKIVNAPTFKTAFDKDWERPTLYDMINSSMGWEEGNNNYANPAMRDAALNRRLSDAEILAFQNGSLSTELQAQVAKYRGSIESAGGAQSVGAGGRTSGSMGTGGGQPSGGMPTTGINLAQLQGANSWGVQPNETVRSQLQQIIADDSPLMQQARTRALQTANSRGLLNSSMARTAADSAMYDAAMPIATQDASTYARAGEFNANTKNTFSRDNNQFVRDAYMADFNVQANDWAAQQQFEREYKMLDRQQQLTLERDAIQNGYTSARDQFAAQQQTIRDDKEAALRLQLGQQDTSLERLRLQLDEQKQSDAVSNLNALRSEYAGKVFSINTSDLSPEKADKAVRDLALTYNPMITAAATKLGYDPNSWIIKIEAPAAPAPATSQAAPAATTDAGRGG